MATSNKSSAFKSKVFTILAGPSQETSYVHASVLAKSDVLQRMVDGQFKETSEQRIDWPHWNANTVENFLEWLYTGDYECPYPVIIPRSTSDGDTQPEDVSLTSSAPAEQKQKKRKRDGQGVVQPAPVAGPQNGLTRLRDLVWNGSLYPDRISYEEEYTKWIGHAHYPINELDYERSLMTHAELYAMGCQYLLEDLRALTWQRLKNALVAVGTPFAGSNLVTNITNVIHYVFEQTAEVPDGREQMRELLTTFATDHCTQMKGTPAFEEILKSPSAPDREFVADMMTKVVANLEQRDALLRVERIKSAKLTSKADEQAELLRMEKEKIA
ncbi:MAG: hypothetical protein Q9212_007151, partial [Teloschistes hypoglaucus]